MMTYAIEFSKDAGLSFGDNNVLKDLDLVISPGEFTTMIGPSGSGKSTLFGCINAMLKLTAGQLLIHGEKVTCPGPDRGNVFQKYSLFPFLTVRDNLLMGNTFKAGSWNAPKEIHDRADFFLEKIGLKDDQHKLPQELSGGMQQRVAIAQALMQQPKILLMDEPFGALDEILRAQMQEMLLDLWFELKPTILFITHEVFEAVRLGTRFIGLSQWYECPETGQKNHNSGARILTDIACRSMNDRPCEDMLSSPKFKDLVRMISENVLQQTHQLPLAEELIHTHADSSSMRNQRSSS